MAAEKGEQQELQQTQRSHREENTEGEKGKPDTMQPAPAADHSHQSSQQQQQQQNNRWTRPQSSYQQQTPTGEWWDQYTKRRTSSRAFNRVSQEEVEEIVSRLRQPTVSSTGAESLRDKQFVYTTPKYTKTNPPIRRKRPEPKSPEERDAIAQRLFSAKTRAWISRREKNPNTRVHYSTDFTII